MKIYVINLEQRKDRYVRMKEQFERLGLEFILFPAVNGKALEDYTASFNTKRFRYESEHELVPGEAGCSLSHIGIWKKMLADGDDYVCVIEDDVSLADQFESFLSNLACYNGFDYIKLDEIDDSIVGYLKGDSSQPSKNLIRSVDVKEFRIVECKAVPYYTAGYIISRRGAAVFLKSARNMYYPIDLLPRYTFPYTRQGFVFPKLVEHLSEKDTDICGRCFEREGKFNRFYHYKSKIFSKARLRNLSAYVRKLSLLIGS